MIETTQCSFLEAINQGALKKKLLATAVFILGAFTSANSFAQTGQPQFALAKNICTGNVANIITSGLNPASCPLATSVLAATDVYFTITVTNPWGQPQQSVNLIDALPVGFTQSGAVVCRDDSTPTPQVITLGAPNGANSIGVVPLAIGATVTCFIQGQYANPPSNATTTSTNTVNANNGGFNLTESVTTNVRPTVSLNADLSVSKISSAAINIPGSSSASITYTIFIKNIGLEDADVGNYFTLHDTLAPPPNGVPLGVEYVSSSCTATPGTDCLQQSGITFPGAPPVFVGPVGQTDFFSWQFAPGAGMIKSGGVITLYITVKVSQIPGINCIVAPNANGLVNTAFFTLANSTGAYTELDPTNNTSSVKTDVNTGQTFEDPNCGQGHLSVNKVQISPPPGSIVPWGTVVTYAITIENNSIPQQAITIKAADFDDAITQGINTPPFFRKHVQTVCQTSTDPLLCSTFNAGIIPDLNTQYTAYGQKKRAWVSNKGFTLGPKGSVTFNTEFIYQNDSCETVPNAKDKPIINTAHLKYMASAYGATNASPQGQTFDISTSAVTLMAPRPVCDFLVTKKINSSTPRIQFGKSFSYDITYTNNGVPRTIGTILDVVRLTIPNYASSVPYTSTWNCKQTGGIQSPIMSGSIQGNATYTVQPTQGAPAANLGSNIYFPAKSTLTCTIDITVNTPAANNAFCTQDKAEFENLALMDVTNPFNPNLIWPPSSTYNPASASNPPPQIVNWATVKAQLPACWDATVNKSAIVVGLPAGSAAWTYSGGPAINYVITTTNKGQSTLGNTSPPPSVPQWTVVDNFNSPYTNANVNAGTPICDPATPSWCHSNPPLDSKSKISVKTLAPLASGKWNLQYPGPFTESVPIRNCANIKPELSKDAANYYQNTRPPQNDACVTIPVVEVTAIKVTKSLVDNTGAGVRAGGPFGMQVTCSPYAIPNIAVSTFSLSTSGKTATSPVHEVYPVARSSIPLNVCTLTETSAPIPPASAQACGGAANVDVITEYQQNAQGPWKPMPAVISPLNNLATGNNITVRNTLKCNKGVLKITKVVVGPKVVKDPNPIFTERGAGTGTGTVRSQDYTINTTCNPAGTPVSLSLNPVTNPSGTVTAPINAQCTIAETPPLLSQDMKDHCASLNQEAVWDSITYNPVNPVNVSAGITAVTVTNTWKCKPKTMMPIRKVLDAGPGGIQLTGLQFTVESNCKPFPSVPTSLTGTSGLSPNGNSIGSFAIPSGSTCDYRESTLPPFPTSVNGVSLCPPNSHPEWNEPKFTIDTFKNEEILVIPTERRSLSSFEKITNSWKCVADIAPPTDIIKVLGPGPGGIQLTGLQFKVETNCTPLASVPTFVTGTSSPSGNLIGQVSIPTGSTCAYSEPTLPAFPAGLCVGSGFPRWKTPTFDTSVANVTTVINAWYCTDSPNIQLNITKVVTGPIVPNVVVPVAPMQAFIFGADCFTPPYNPTKTVNASGSSNGSGPFTLPANRACVLTETLPTIDPALTAFCNNLNGTSAVWETPVYSPSDTILTNSVGLAVTVTNKWKCGPPLSIAKIKTSPVTPIELVKQISGPSPVANSLNFIVTANCTPASAQGRINILTNQAGTGSVKLDVPSGAQCSFSQTRPPLPAAAQEYCAKLERQPAQWNEVLPFASATAGQRLVLQDSWKCVGSPPIKIVIPPPVPVAPSPIKQPPGRHSDVLK